MNECDGGSREEAGSSRVRAEMTEGNAGIDRRGFLTLAGATMAAVGVGGVGGGVRVSAAGMVEQAGGQAGGAGGGEPPVPPGIDLRTIVEGEKLAKVEFDDAKRGQILKTIKDQTDIYDLLRGASLRNEEGPAEVFDPRLPGFVYSSERRAGKFAEMDPGALPGEEEEIAFAPVTSLSRWIRTRKITSERLTEIYLGRLKKHGPGLECVVTLMEESGLAQARRADKEIASGRYRGPLHGVPWGAKDLFDTKGTRTTWGAEPWMDRVPDRDAAVVRRLDEAGAVLAAKLTLGALAYGDIWFGGKTRNPFNREQGSSGSSAGSASAVSAGLVGFALGTETYGSIASPSARCGATGFRPTFGRVSRAGAMALCWSLDKVGPIARTVEDCAMVLEAVHGPDGEDAATSDLPLNIDMTAGIAGMRVGYPKAEYESENANEADRKGLEALGRLGVSLVPIEIPEGKYGEVIFFLISVEAAAAFDEMTRSRRDETLKWQADEAWPNTFRMTRLSPAVEYMQARRVRRRFMTTAAELFAKVDAIIAPREHGALHALTNMTGQPAVTIRQGFREDGTPSGVTLWGGLYEDARLLRLGAALEREIGLWQRRPKLG